MRVGITGHRGLSTEVEERVRALLADAVSGYDAAEPVAVSCLADGPDAWFGEAVLSAGGRLEVVVPATEYRDSLPERHHSTYDELMSRASGVHETGMTDSDSEAHMTGSQILVGLADELVAVWDGKPAWGHGGRRGVRRANGRPRPGAVAGGRLTLTGPEPPGPRRTLSADPPVPRWPVAGM